MFALFLSPAQRGIPMAPPPPRCSQALYLPPGNPGEPRCERRARRRGPRNPDPGTAQGTESPLKGHSWALWEPETHEAHPGCECTATSPTCSEMVQGIRSPEAFFPLERLFMMDWREISPSMHTCQERHRTMEHTQNAFCCSAIAGSEATLESFSHLNNSQDFW